MELELVGGEGGGLSFYWTGLDWREKEGRFEARTLPFKAKKNSKEEGQGGREGRGGRALPSGGPSRTP